MNEINHASLEASQRLRDAGIVIETGWFYDTRGELHLNVGMLGSKIITEGSWPAPSMAEIWRELPEGYSIYKGLTLSEAFPENRPMYSCINANPTDALIDLLIWKRKEKDHD